ncbi:MAG: MFS transporter [Cyanobacteria bacterium P01_H01_bin.35]
MGAGSLFYILRILDNSPQLLKPVEDSRPGFLEKFKTYRSLIYAGIAGLLFWSSFDSLLPTLPKYLEDLGATRWQVGMVMCCFTIGLFGLRPQMGYLADLRSRKLVLTIGVSIVAVTPLLYMFVDSIGLLMVIRAFHGIAIAGFTTAYSAMVVAESPVEKRGQLVGYFSMVRPLGMSIGPAVGAFIQTEMGDRSLFFFAGGIGLLALLCVTQIYEPKRNQSTNKKDWTTLSNREHRN